MTVYTAMIRVEVPDGVKSSIVEFKDQLESVLGLELELGGELLTPKISSVSVTNKPGKGQ